MKRDISETVQQDKALKSEDSVKLHLHSPQFSVHLRCGQMAGWIKMLLGMEVGLGPGDCVRWGTSPIQKGHSPPPPKKKLAHVYCGQTAGCIRIPLGAEVGLSPGEIVLDGNPAPPKEAQPPIFGRCPLLPNGWMDQECE